MHHVSLTGNHDELQAEKPVSWTKSPKPNLSVERRDLFPLVDVEAVVLQLLLQDVRDADVHVNRFLFTLPLDVQLRLNPLRSDGWTVRRIKKEKKTINPPSGFTILFMSSEKVLSPLFEESSGSESSPSLLSELEIRPGSDTAVSFSRRLSIKRLFWRKFSCCLRAKTCF